MSYSVLIVDDEEDARELLKVHLRRHPDYQIIGEAGNGHEAVALIDDLNPDIVFLDIQMPEINGVEVVERVQNSPAFIFVTAYDEFAVKAFELNSLDYLLKPVADSRFDQAIQRIASTVLNKNKGEYNDLVSNIAASLSKPKEYLKRFTYRKGLKTIYISVDDVIMIESADQYVEINTRTEKYLLRLSMDYLEQTLDPGLFFRSHRSFIVKLSAVSSIEQFEPRNYLIHMDNGKQARLTRDKKEDLNKLLTGS